MGLATVLWGVSAHAQVATLSASEITLAPGEGGVVQVSGEISGYVSYGVTILVELVPQPGTVGQLVFTHAPPVDVHQLGDPWPTVGTFTPFDTNATAFGPTLNGSVDDDGQFVCENLTTYSGLLAGFPVKAADNAWGVWDVLLSTSVGKSNWECVADVDPKGGVETELFAGTITVTTNVPAASTWGLTIFTLLLGTTGTLLIRRNNRGSTLPALSNAKHPTRHTTPGSDTALTHARMFKVFLLTIGLLLLTQTDRILCERLRPILNRKRRGTSQTNTPG